MSFSFIVRPSQVVPNNGTTAGGEIDTIHGTAFGRTEGAEVAETVFFCNTAAKHYLQAFVGDVPCAKTTWVWDSEVRCKLPAGVGKNHSITVKVANQVTAIVPGTTDFAYRAPSISFVSPVEGLYGGGGLLLMEGLNFSPNNTVVTVGGVPCPIVEENFVRLKCTPPRRRRRGGGARRGGTTCAEKRTYTHAAGLRTSAEHAHASHRQRGLLSAQPLVELRDALGDLVLSGPDAFGTSNQAHVVKVSVSPKPLSVGGSNLLGVVVEAGVATFTDLELKGLRNGTYNMTFSLSLADGRSFAKTVAVRVAACAKGQMGTVDGACECAPGYTLGATGCMACRDGFYKPRMGSAPCTACPDPRLQFTCDTYECTRGIPSHRRDPVQV